MTDFVLKQGDLEPPVLFTLLTSAGVPVNVTTATSIKFAMAPVATRVELFSRNATVVSAALGQLSYIWQLGDTLIAGVYYGEFAVEWPGPRDQTFPSSGYLTISIEPKL